jgi:hypothetical protein
MASMTSWPGTTGAVFVLFSRFISDNDFPLDFLRKVVSNSFRIDSLISYAFELRSELEMTLYLCSDEKSSSSD